MIRRLAVLGLGLLGGSVAKAARVHGLAAEIVGVGRDEARLRPALADGTLDRATTEIAAGVREADLVVLAVPVAASERLLEAVWPVVSADALVTDVGSTKGGIVRAAERLGRRRRVHFVGSHPMAGSEQSGYAAARADLFQGAAVFVTPSERTEPRALKGVTGFWEALGAGRVAVLDADSHDRTVAAISHLPHLVAFALVEAVARFEPGALEHAARGFKDTTRVAAADADVWQQIFLENREAMVAGIAAFRQGLDDLVRLIERGDAAGLREALERIRARREALR